MASSSPLRERRSAGSRSSSNSNAPDDREDEDHGVLERAAPELATPIRAAGFWTAIVFPVLYLPLLATGLSSSLEGGVFLALILGNLLALYVGHAYRQ
ncbi:hypothetical protein [Natrinema salifodinae]|uniref:Uncharacterized protein n=1 Tax=Natrinema salifodinae TaxID=1202768 RepID=A0A1I0LX26_9EURY|nr:hypothetical protein [Natrinema salifodinae]SEV79922.1 hypothetical protein SAMN05216285_0043 [Natrinema salifodinae]